MVMDTPTKSKRNANGTIAFPQDFKIVKRIVSSEFNKKSEDVLSTGFFSRGSYEYPADKTSALVLSDMEWNNMSNPDKERIACFWIDHLLHPLNGILWSSYLEGETSQCFGGSLNLFKPTFNAPTTEVHQDGSVTVVYWEYDIKHRVVRNHRVVFDKNGNITERKIINSSPSQFNYGIGVSFGLAALSFASFFVLKSGVLRKFIK